MPTSRLEAFSDGVFAIAITILIFDIKAPTNTQHLLPALLALWPSYLGYVLSFLLIGLLWVNHHVMFEHIIKADRLLMFVNTVLLLVVAFVPFATSVLAATFRNGDGENIAVALYGVTLTAAGLLFNAIWSHADRGGLFDDGVTAHGIRRMTKRILFGPAMYAIGAVIGFFLPVVGVVVYALLILFYWLPIPQRDRNGVRIGSH
ncbi:MAG TPA: TMEM175 family protein [Galbitalea sp.]|nr:TMEM175 family protein [Galbitalea sp.]